MYINDSAEIRKIIDKIDDKLNEHESYSFFGILNYVIYKMEKRYNLQEKEIVKQLELILDSLEEVK